MSDQDRNEEESITEEELSEIEILKRLGALSYDELRAAYAHIEHRLGFSNHDEAQVLAVRRRVAKGILRAACVKVRPVDECEALLNQALALGFENLYERALTVFPFCRYCFDAGQSNVALRYLSPLATDVEHHQAETGAAWCANILPPIRLLIERMHSIPIDP